MKKTISVKVKFPPSSMVLPAYTVDITSTGARIGGLKHLPQAGDLIEVEIQAKKNPCRVVWVGEPGTEAEGQIGVVVEGKRALFASSILEFEAKAAAATQKEPARQKVPLEQQPLRNSNHKKKMIGLAMLAAAALGYLIFFTGQTPRPAPTTLPLSQVTPQDTAQIHDLEKWRLAQSSDFDPETSAWLTTMGQQAQGHITVKFSGDDSSGDSAYIFATTQTNSDPRLRRLVLVVNNQVQYDANFPQIAIAAVVPKNELRNVTWQGGFSDVQPSGDGLLIVRRPKDPASAIVVFLSGVRIVTRAPADYKSIQLR